MKKIALLLLAAFVLPVFAQATPDKAIRALVEGKLGGKVDQINKSPIAGLYEVVSDGQIFYVDAKAGYFIAGNLIEVKTMKNLTADKKAEIAESKLSKIRYDNAIKLVRGDGKNVIVTFEDPNCGYCKKLWSELKQINNVTIYTFVIPILSEDSVAKAKAIWCSADRGKAWSEWMMNGVAPAASGAKCDAEQVLDKNLKLSQSLGVRGTPFIYFPATKQQVPGFIPAAEIEKNLNRSGG